MAGQAIAIDHEQVRLVAVQIGVREAARQFGLPEDTVKTWSRREGWLVQEEQKQELVQKAVAIVREKQGLNPIEPNASEILLKFNGETRMGHAVAAHKVANKLKQMDEDELFMSGQLLQQHAKHASTVFGWEANSAGVTVNVGVISDHIQDCPAIEL